MTLPNTPLWRALAAMTIEPPGAAVTFTARLARDNRWSRRHADAVMEEYRRFLYLAVTGSKPITPPVDVDQAWHLHLTYSRHYWDEMCGRILGRPLHHDPTEGGPAQQAHFLAQYAATLDRYRAAFGEPPTAIWPAPAVRFAPPRSRLAFPRLAAAGSTALLAGACTALTAATGEPDTRIVGVIVLLLAVIASVILLVTLTVVRQARRRRAARAGAAGGGGGSGASASDIDCGDGGSGCGGSGCGGGCGS